MRPDSTTPNDPAALRAEAGRLRAAAVAAAASAEALHSRADATYRAAARVEGQRRDRRAKAAAE
jgi:hypothetical protein